MVVTHNDASLVLPIWQCIEIGKTLFIELKETKRTNLDKPLFAPQGPGARSRLWAAALLMER